MKMSLEKNKKIVRKKKNILKCGLIKVRDTQKRKEIKKQRRNDK